MGGARGSDLRSSRLFLLIGLAAAAAGAALWHFTRPQPAGEGTPLVPRISPAAIQAAAFLDGSGQRRALGEFSGKVVVLNFWATWCAPCREEMPAFERVRQRWAGRQVQFVGLSADPPDAAARFAREVGVGYPLWTGGDEVMDLSRRLGNQQGVLPHTVILGPLGEVIEQRVGPYTEQELDTRLALISSKTG